MPIAANEQTGEVLYTDEGGRWQPAKVAINPKTNERVAFDGKDWVKVGAAPDPDQVPIGTTQASSKREISQGKAFGLGTIQGATANFGDELAGAHAAGTAWMPDIVKSITKLAPGALEQGLAAGVPVVAGLGRMAYESLSGQNDPTLSSTITGDVKKGVATTAYEQARDEFRQDYKAAQEQHPITTGTGNVAGALVAPTGKIMAAPTLAGRMVRSGVAGGIYGGVSGVGEGEDAADRATRGAAGAVVGTAVGSVAPPLIEGAIATVNALARPVVSAVRGIVDPTGEAARRVGRSIERDVINDPTAADRLSPQEFAAASQNGGPARVMDMGGETTRALARSSANTSPEGRAILNQPINERFENAPERMADFVSAGLNYPTENARNAAIKNVSKTIYEPRYTAAYKDDASTGLWPTAEVRKIPGLESLPDKFSKDHEALLRDLTEIAQAPEVQTAIRLANANLRNWAVKDQNAVRAANPQMRNFITTPPRPFLDVVKGETVINPVESKSGSSVKNVPTLQYWDYIKRALDQMGTPTASSFARTIRNNLDELIPAYKTARDAAQPTKFFDGAKNAFEAGQNFFNRGEQFGSQAQSAIKKMEPQEQELFRDGYANEIISKLRNTADRRTITNRLFNTPNLRTELETALGSQRSRELEAQMRIEGIMDMARTAVQGNSTTARQLAELGLAGGAGVYGYLTGDPQAAMNAALVWGAARGHRAIDARVAREVAQMLSSSDPQKLLRGIQMVSRNNRLMDNLRNLDTRIARMGAFETPVPAINAGGIGRAEEDN